MVVVEASNQAMDNFQSWGKDSSSMQESLLSLRRESPGSKFRTPFLDSFLLKSVMKVPTKTCTLEV